VTSAGAPRHLLEARLRQALDARAQTVGPRDLRPATAPSQRRHRSRPPVRALAIALAGVAAAVVCVLLVPGPRRDEPAGPTTPTVFSTHTPSPRPAPVRTSPIPGPAVSHASEPSRGGKPPTEELPAPKQSTAELPAGGAPAEGTEQSPSPLSGR
jgi:hypothetical protein